MTLDPDPLYVEPETPDFGVQYAENHWPDRPRWPRLTLVLAVILGAVVVLLAVQGMAS